MLRERGEGEREEKGGREGGKEREGMGGREGGKGRLGVEGRERGYYFKNKLYRKIVDTCLIYFRRKFYIITLLLLFVQL